MTDVFSSDAPAVPAYPPATCNEIAPPHRVLRPPCAALVAAAEMYTDHSIGAPVDPVDHGVIRSNGCAQRLIEINTALSQQFAPLAVEKVRVRRRIELHVRRAFVEQSLHFFAHDRGHIL